MATGIKSEQVSNNQGRMGRVHYKWIALSNTTIAVFLAMINSSIMLIALPNMSPIRPKLTTKTAVTTMNPIKSQRR